ncbi:hypothetical protein [Nitrosomonas oligotropha]|uniref:Uncharacterized protein n=1 Tax=Nitrosomonas oligotropha TaxID=42354 RepID=A0A1H8V646_9PROT|nr:hypothetical protein [Nitrosomonas oligotropha]SDX54391.1 hypothetical protein SAMN05216300_14810 [Nitrosomonas oligotropha]SEP10733.1 hypothetical protein SAMN05216333_14610 [Nitrosomonas oligotropha]
MNLKRNLLILLAILLLTSCSTKLISRYKSMEMTSRLPGNPPLVQVSAFSMTSATSEDKPAILQLSAEGQAALITEIAKTEKSSIGLFQRLASGFDSDSPSDVVDRTQYKVRIVFSTQKTEIVTGLADRISQLQLKLDKLPDSFQFKHWNKFETEYGQVDLGKIGLKKATTFTAKANPSFGGASTGEIGVTNSKELNEEVTLRQRFITNTGVLDKNTATLFQEGVTGIDLAGNIAIDVTVEVNPNQVETFSTVRFESLKDDKGYKAANQLSMIRTTIKAPESSVLNNLKNGVLVNLTGSYIFRHVRKGDQTIAEGDDEVEFIRGNIAVIPKEIIILSKEQLERTRYRYFIHPMGSPGKNLSIDLPENPDQSLEFATFREADQFLGWLRNTRSTKIGKGDWQLKLGHSPLLKKDIMNLRINHRF